MDGLLGVAGMILTYYYYSDEMDHSRKFPFRNFAPVSHSHQFSGCSFVAFGFPLFSRNPVFFPDVPSASQGEPPTGWHHLTPGAGGSPLPGGWGPWVSPWLRKATTMVFQMCIPILIILFHIYIYISYHHDIYLSIYLFMIILLDTPNNPHLKIFYDISVLTPWWLRKRPY